LGIYKFDLGIQNIIWEFLGIYKLGNFFAEKSDLLNFIKIGIYTPMCISKTWEFWEFWEFTKTPCAARVSKG